MWTLRDLIMWLNPEYAQRWREGKAKQMSQGYMDDNFDLQNLLYKKQWQVNQNPSLGPSQFLPPSLDSYYKGMQEGYDRYKAPPKYPGGI